MKILVLGGTRYFGKQLVRKLLGNGHEVTIATRGMMKDDFGTAVKRMIVDHTDFNDMKTKFEGKSYDVVYDNLAYCSNDVKHTLESIKCGRYIMVSSALVYPLYWDTKEDAFQPENKDLVWCSRSDFSYGEGKRKAESALVNQYGDIHFVIIRFPFVLGKNDYTGRLKFYVDHVKSEKPMFIDNLDCQMSVISEEEAGAFLAHMADHTFSGIVNGCSEGTVSVKEILQYVEESTGKKAILNHSGDKAPFNEMEEYSLNIQRAGETGFEFFHVQDWIFELLDYYING